MSRQATDMRSRLRANIRRAIEESDLTLAEIARRIPKGHESAIRRWRDGKVTPNGDSLVLLAIALDLEVAWFYADHDAVPA